MRFEISYEQLANGVRFLAVPLANVESVTALVLVRTGSRNESESQAGISHILEHMLFKGTKSYPSPMAIAEKVDGIGALNNAFTGKEYTGYYITSAAKHLPITLDILSEMITAPLLPQVDLEREREVIVEEINMYEDTPIDKAAEEWENLVYAGSSMGRQIIGTKETVRATNAIDLRAYMDEWYVGGNVLVVVAGKIGGELADLVKTKFAGVKKSTILPYVSPIKYGKAEARHIKKKTEQAHFWMGVPGVSMSDSKRYALQLASVILGGGMSSRLFNEIREKRGLAYYVKAELDTAYDGGYLGVKAGVALDKLDEAMSVVKEELVKLPTTITKAELVKAKEYVLGHLPLQLEDTMGVAQFVGMRALILDEIRQPAEVEAAVRAVSLDEIKKVTGELMIPELLRSVVVGPEK